MRNFDVWYARLDVDTLLADVAKVADAKQMKTARKNVAKAGKKNRPQGVRSPRPRGSTASRGSSAIRRCWFRLAS